MKVRSIKIYRRPNETNVRYPRGTNNSQLARATSVKIGNPSKTKVL